MAGINLFGDYSGNNNNYNNFFSLSGSNNTQSSAFNLADYASIKNGSYGKLMKAYYKQQDEESAKTSTEAGKSLSQMRGSSDALKDSAAALTEKSLWNLQKTTVKDEETGEEKEAEDYKWDDIVKAVKSFVDDYNDVVGKAADSDTKGVLRNAVWMTKATKSNSGLLGSVGISIGKENKLSVDDDKLRKANINTLKTLFSGKSSYADQVSQKASAISAAAASKDSGYNSKGGYSGSSGVSSILDTEV
ncbi:MAG: hypothetical protein K6F35_09755 [Lachnospiraceae bacterium]|nr:hypothetical protein [Lachnospiraceae bacterium]